jgi:hypothetical protein
LERKRLNQFEAPASERDWHPEKEPEKDGKSAIIKNGCKMRHNDYIRDITGDNNA